MIRYKSSLFKYKSCKRGWIAWMIPENFRTWDRITVEIFSRESFQVLDLCQAATDACYWFMEFVWTTAKRFWQSTSYVRFITDTLSRNSSLNESKCHRFDSSAGRYRATCREWWRTNWEHDNNADVWKKAANHELFLTIGSSTACYGCTAKTADIGASFRQIHQSIIIFLLADKFQNPGEFLLRFSLGGNVMDQRSGDGRLGGWSKILAINWRKVFPEILKCWTRELLLLWTRSSRIPTSRKRSVWRNRKLRKKIESFAEDRSPSWSVTTFVLLVLMTQFLTMRIYCQSLFATTTFRNSIRDGTKFYYLWPRSHQMMFWRVCTTWEYVSLINSGPY